MRIALYVTCLVDQVWPSVGVAAVDLLRGVGCDVVFDPQATCCGQPAFNAGYRAEAAGQARQWITSFERCGAEFAVLPSGSCTAMVHEFDQLFADDASWRDRARAMAAHTHDLAGFLTDVVGATAFPGRFDGRVAWHDGCHGLRELGLSSEPRALIRAVAGTELIEIEDADVCCGFGGTFAVKFPELSVAIADRKIDALAAAGVDAVVGGDVSCLLHIGGRLQRLGSPVRTLHLAELLTWGTEPPR